MKRLSIFTVFSLILLAVSTAFAQWATHYLPGDNIVETIVVDESDVKGIWAVNKDGGIGWLGWDDENNDDWNDNFDLHDAYYRWFMGGDVFSISYNDSTDTLFTIVGTMQGHHLYYYNDNDDEWKPLGAGFLENNYYQYNDIAFFHVDGQTASPQHYLLSTWQCWDGTPSVLDDYQLGLFLITDGQTPGALADPIVDTEGKVYDHIYRSLVCTDTFYTWYNNYYNPPEPVCAFHKVTVTFDDPNYEASVANDFDVDEVNLNGISAFYQCQDADTIHQYLLAGDRISPTVVETNVYHRDDSDGSLSATEWDIEWDGLEANLDVSPDRGLAARQYDATNSYHYIYLLSWQEGLLGYDTQNNLYNTGVIAPSRLFPPLFPRRLWKSVQAGGGR